ncbi:hypothetical protein G6F60_014699 [Rhizopus arrhizus]|nr:hypothetical protein G6F60_014699 [Rhizopus arrhizus]
MLRAQPVPGTHAVQFTAQPQFQAVAVVEGRFAVKSIEFHQRSPSAQCHDTLYLKSPFLPAVTLMALIRFPSAIAASTLSAISGSRVPLRMWSTLRAPESTSVQRASTASTRLSSQLKVAL